MGPLVLFFFCFILASCGKIRKKRHIGRKCPKSCSKKLRKNGRCEKRCFRHSCDWDWGNCKSGCKGQVKGNEFLKDPEVREVWHRLYQKRHTITIQNGEYVRDFDFKTAKPLSDDFDPTKPGWKYPWGKLKEVLVGHITPQGDVNCPIFVMSADSVDEFEGAKPSKDICGDTKHFFVKQRRMDKNGGKLVKKRRIQVKNFIKELEKHGVRVRRPLLLKPLKRGNIIPNWTFMRDALLVIGNHFFPARWSWPNRYPSYSMLWPVLRDMEERGAHVHRWTPPDLHSGHFWNLAGVPPAFRKCFPKRDFPARDCKYVEREQIMKERFVYPITRPGEITFEGADWAPIGQDVFTQVSYANTYPAIKYISKKLGKNYRVHILPNTKATIHFDPILCPIKPGVAVIGSFDLPKKDLPSYFDNWMLIEGSKKVNGFDDNILLIDESTVMVQASMVKHLPWKKMGMKVIKIPYDTVATMGGGLHCTTSGLSRAPGKPAPK